MKAPTRLLELREHAMLSRNELSKRTGVAQETIARLERGESSVWPRTVRKLAEGLGVGYEELYEAPKTLAPPSLAEPEERREPEERDGIGSVRGKKIGEARARLERARQDLTNVGTTGEESLESLFGKVVEDIGRLDEQLAELQRSVEEGQRARGDAVGSTKSA